MPEMPLLAGMFQHFILPFALFGLPLVLLGVVGAFFVWKDYQQAVDTTSAAERLAQALEEHRKQANEAGERQRLAMEHAQEQYEHELWQARQTTLRALHAQMRACASAGMAADLHAACQACLDIDPDDALARRYQASLAQQPIHA
ncbi:MAG: hypothetical protein EA401_02895 [Planctomycetota bacterium]|nr:MAG: hypothetical protein EA401_02895 [Planctomycetota bacterium]